MQKIFSIGLIALGIISLTLNACRKDKEGTGDDFKNQTIAARDEADMEAASEQSLEDINSAIDGSSLAGKALGPRPFVLCGSTVDTSQKAQGRITITYDGTSVCNGKKRTGSVLIQFPAGKKWRDVGTRISATFNSLKFTRVIDGKSITLDGQKSITNVNGGIVSEQTNGQTIVHKVRGNLSLTFDNGTVRNWVVARLKTITLIDSVYQLKVEGDTTVDGTANVVIFGTNRAGRAFRVAIATPIIANSTCFFYRPVQGVKVHSGLEREIIVTFGVDEGGNSVSSGCAYGYKAEWKNARGQQKTLITQYR